LEPRRCFAEELGGIGIGIGGFTAEAEGEGEGEGEAGGVGAEVGRRQTAVSVVKMRDRAMAKAATRISWPWV